MALLDDVVAWAATRAWWQQQLLARLARGETIAEAGVSELADSILGPEPTAPAGGWLGELTLPERSTEDQVRLVAVSDVTNVNRLLADQRLTFGSTGLTVIFGSNGSGKSGYARIIQTMVRSRQRPEILPDVFGGSSGDGSARLEYEVGGTPREIGLGQTPPIELGRAAYYDEKCGDDYLLRESEVAFRPTALNLLDDLVHLCGQVRNVLAQKLQELDTQPWTIPEIAAGTEVADWIRTISADTTDAEMALKCAPIEGDQDLLNGLVGQEARLRATDPRREKTRLEKLADAAAGLADHLTTLNFSLGEASAAELTQLAGRAQDLREAAELAAVSGVGDAPLQPVGTGAWRALWQAAADYSREVTADSATHPPNHAGDLCVLCQQSLTPQTAVRMQRFEAAMSDRTEADARAAEAAHQQKRSVIKSAILWPNQVAIALEILKADHEDLSAQMITLLENWSQRRTALLEVTDVPAPQSAQLIAAIKAAESSARNAAALVDADTIAGELVTNASMQQELRARLALSPNATKVTALRDRLVRRRALEQARSAAATNGITEKIGELTRQHVTVAMQDRFSRQSDRLGVERITLRDTRAQYGTLLHKPDFVGAAIAASIPEVLSEGEQTALGLAGFLTEAYFDDSASTLILDDPVTSLDHLRRDRVADALAEFAASRQVLVFTHDIAFTVELKRSAVRRGVAYTERCITLGAGKAPGLALDHHPWVAQDALARLDKLNQRVAELRRSEEEWTQAEYDDAARKVAGEMSETWERIISQEIAGQLVTPDSRVVQAKMMKVVRQINEDDEKEFQESYSRISAWAPRHDNHPDFNYVAPSITEIEAEVELMTAWFKRIKRYKNN